MSETRTRQEIFDVVYRGLQEQGFRRSENNYRCAYRSSEGLKCAVGQLIPDERYSADLEGKAASS
ncbi:hypothetical protein ACQ3G6_16250, partial [Allorhizobium undicola]|uniref:hypothetical protein n=1 Tax=Allorhizobium undicola TaxID=78527 RepID=UPI003D33B4A7